MQIQYRRAKTKDELEQIISLQRKNIKTTLPSEEIEKEGFITVSHSFELLKRMNDRCPHIIAQVSDKLVGYALCMTSTFRKEIPLLIPMFEKADVMLPGKKYIVMGQICIDKAYRKKGIFKNMYAFYKSELQSEYDGVVTEVATNNLRSLNAHLSVGFETIHTHIEEGVSWELIYWNWR